MCAVSTHGDADGMCTLRSGDYVAWYVLSNASWYGSAPWTVNQSDLFPSLAMENAFAIVYCHSVSSSAVFPSWTSLAMETSAIIHAP